MALTTSTKTPIKYVVRIREIEHDQRTERSHIFLEEVDALELQKRAETHGFHATILKVADWKRLENNE